MYETLLQRISPRWLMRWVLLISIIDSIWRALFGSMVGTLILALSSYVWMWNFSETRPLTLAELAIWISESSIEIKTAVATSLLTIVGFLVAFYSSTISWRTQERMRLQMRAGEEIEKFFSDALSTITDLEIYVRRLRDTHQLISTAKDVEGARFKLDFVLGKTSTFLENRARLSSMSVDAHRLKGRYHGLLSQTWALDNALTDAINSLSEIADDVWLDAPEFSTDEPNKHELFLRFVDVDQCEKFLESCRRHHGAISALIGGISGTLAAPIVGYNLATLMGIIKQRGILEEALFAVKTSKSHRKNAKR